MMSSGKRCGDRPLIFGHRGVPLVYQENTLAGFQEAITLGLDGVELDVFLTRDQELVVFHDVDTQRLTGEAGKITEMTWPEIQRLRIQSSINVGRRTLTFAQPEKIPLLRDFLAIAKQKLLINLEIKPIPSMWRQRQTVKAVLALLSELEMEEQVFISSFDPWAIFWLWQSAAKFDYGLIVSSESPQWLQAIATAKILGTSLVSLSLDLCRPEKIAIAQKNRLAIAVWTVFSRNSLEHDAEEKHIQNLVEQKIDYLITDDPTKLKALLNRL